MKVSLAVGSFSLKGGSMYKGCHQAAHPWPQNTYPRRENIKYSAQGLVYSFYPAMYIVIYVNNRNIHHMIPNTTVWQKKYHIHIYNFAVKYTESLWYLQLSYQISDRTVWMCKDSVKNKYLISDQPADYWLIYH